jgi:hypothetical protein
MSNLFIYRGDKKQRPKTQLAARYFDSWFLYTPAYIQTLIEFNPVWANIGGLALSAGVVLSRIVVPSDTYV